MERRREGDTQLKREREETLGVERGRWTYFGEERGHLSDSRVDLLRAWNEATEERDVIRQ